MEFKKIKPDIPSSMTQRLIHSVTLRNQRRKKKQKLDKLVGERRMEPGQEQAGVRNRN